MSYDEERVKKSRVVVETPAARREVVETSAAYVPDRRGVSTGVVAIVALAAVVLTAIVVWALTRPRAEDEINVNARAAATQPTPITQVVTVPVPQQQPVVMPPTTTTQPVIVPVPATTTTTSPATTTATDTAKANGTDDLTIQTNIEKKLSDDPKMAALGITVSVIDGKVTLMGTVDSRAVKDRVERLAKIKGVKTVDNQIIVSGAADSPSQD